MRTRRPRYGLALVVGLLVSAVLHLALFLLDPGLGLPAGAPGDRPLRLVAFTPELPPPAPPQIRVPEAPPPVFRPGPPVVEAGAPPEVQPTYIPHDIAPRLENPAHVQQLLQSLYPADLRDEGVGGVVGLWLFVDQRGAVTRVRIREPSRHPELDQVAAQVARAMEFRPAFNHDEPVGVWVSQPIRFVAIPAAAGRGAAGADTSGGGAR